MRQRVQHSFKVPSDNPVISGATLQSSTSHFLSLEVLEMDPSIVAIVVVVVVVVVVVRDVSCVCVG